MQNAASTRRPRSSPRGANGIIPMMKAWTSQRASSRRNPWRSRQKSRLRRTSPWRRASRKTRLLHRHSKRNDQGRDKRKGTWERPSQTRLFGPGSWDQSSPSSSRRRSPGQSPMRDLVFGRRDAPSPRRALRCSCSCDRTGILATIPKGRAFQHLCPMLAIGRGRRLPSPTVGDQFRLPLGGFDHAIIAVRALALLKRCRCRWRAYPMSPEQTRSMGVVTRHHPLMQMSGRRRATLRARPACSAAATTALTSL